MRKANSSSTLVSPTKIVSLQPLILRHQAPRQPSQQLLAYHKYYRPSRQFIQKKKHIQKQLKGIQRQIQNRAPVRIMRRNVVRYDGQPKKKQLLRIYDWMMQAASLLKMSKNAFYRAIIIFKMVQKQGRSFPCHKLNHYLCASLCLGAKVQCSRKDYLHAVFAVNNQRVSKTQITLAEQHIMQMLKWSLPLYVFVEEQLTQLIAAWNIQSSQWGDKSWSKLWIGMGERGCNRLYIQVVFILDHLVTSKPDFLDHSFEQPILIAMYVVLSLFMGDLFLTQGSFWPYFHEYLFELGWCEEQRARLRYRILREFNQLRLLQVLGQIPLNLNCQGLARKRHEQLYIYKMESS